MTIPEHTKAAIDRYVMHRLPPGGFLTAVLTNNLVGAVTRADVHNLEALLEIVRYVYNEVPASAWGSEQRVEDYLEGR